MKTLTDEEVIAAIEQEEQAAYGYLSSELAAQREAAMDRYLGRPYGNERDGRSQIVSSDIADAVEWVLPSLLKVFLSGDDVVEFLAKGPDDEEKARQETDYCSSIILERNNAFLLFNTWFKDALLQKNGYVKTVWHKSNDVTIETYYGKSQEEMDFLLHDDDIEVIGQRAYPDPEPPADMLAAAPPGGPPPPGPPPGPPPLLYDVRVRRKEPREFVRIEPLPPEEVLVSVKARQVSIQEAPFVQHRTRKTLSELRQMGYFIDDDIADNSDEMMTAESIARDRFGEDSVRNASSEGVDASMREVTLRETWLRIDRDGDGVAELRQVCVVGTTILQTADGPADYECEVIPIAAITPVLMSHRHVGISYYDLIHDIALIKTTLMRGLLDNLYLANNGRTAVDTNAVNIEDMLVSRPGGVIRVDGSPVQAFLPVQHVDMSQAALAGLGYMDDVKESRMGVSKYSQGLAPDTLVKTATQSSQMLTASQSRIEMIARCFAETGVKELFYLVHQLTLKHARKEEIVKLRNRWVPVNPREWVDRFDLQINVGLGTGNKDQMLGHLQMILQGQKEGMQFGFTNPSKIYNTLTRITQNAGFKNAELFWTDPGPQPPQPPPPPEVQAAQMTADAQKQIEQMRGQAQMQLTQQQSQIKHGADMQIAAASAETQKQVEQMKAQLQIQLKQMENDSRELIASLAEETKRMVAANQVNLKLQQGVQPGGVQ